MLLWWIGYLSLASTVVPSHVPSVGDIQGKTCTAGDPTQLGAPGKITHVRTGAIVGSHRDLALAVGPTGSGWAVWRGQDGLLARPFNAQAKPTGDAIRLPIQGSPLFAHPTDDGGLLVLTSSTDFIASKRVTTRRVVYVDASHAVVGPIELAQGPRQTVDGIGSGTGLARVYLGGMPGVENDVQIIDITKSESGLSQQARQLQGPGFGGSGRPHTVDLPGAKGALWIHPTGVMEWIDEGTRRPFAPKLDVPAFSLLRIARVRPRKDGVVLSVNKQTVLATTPAGQTLQTVPTAQRPASWIMDTRSTIPKLVAVSDSARPLGDPVSITVGGDLRWLSTPTGAMVVGRTDTDVSIMSIQCKAPNK